MPIGVRSSRGQPSILPRPPGMLPLPPRLSHTQNRNLIQSDSTSAPVPFPPPLPGLGQLGLPPIPPPPPLPPFFGGQIRNPLYDNTMYGINNRMGTLNPLHIPYGPNGLDPLSALNGRSLMENSYYSSSSSSSRKYDDYEDQLERFNRQLESRSRRYRDDDRSGRSIMIDNRRRDHSRSRSPSASSHQRNRRSRSRSISSRGSSPSSIRSHRSPSRSSSNRHHRSRDDSRKRSRSHSRDRDRSYHSSSSSHRGSKRSSRYTESENNEFSTKGQGPPRIEGMISLKVDNITHRTTVSQLKRLFSRYGELGDIYVPRYPDSYMTRGFAFVRYYRKRDAEEAMRKLDGERLDGRVLSIQMAKYARPNSRQRKRTEYRSKRRSRTPDR